MMILSGLSWCGSDYFRLMVSSSDFMSGPKTRTEELKQKNGNLHLQLGQDNNRQFYDDVHDDNNHDHHDHDHDDRVG